MTEADARNFFVGLLQARMGDFIEPESVRKGPDGEWVATVKGPALLAIVSKFCHHCEALKTTISKASQDRPVRVYYISADRKDPTTQDLMRSMDVTGVPDIYRVDGSGKLVPYTGKTDPDSLLRHFGGSSSACHRWEMRILPFALLVAFVIWFLLLRR
jgi:thioredoxin family protein